MEDDALSADRKRFGEVVEVSTTEFTVQCYRLYEAPPLGSLVQCGGDTPIYGIVSEVSTRSMDPARRPIPRGQNEETEESIYLANPQLGRLLHTEFRSTSVGHRPGGSIRRYLAPLPPRLHSFVYRSEGEELRAFSSSLEFIPLLLAAPVGSPDDVVASFLRQASESHDDPDRFLVDAGRELARLLGDRLQRLNNLLRRLSA